MREASIYCDIELAGCKKVKEKGEEPAIIHQLKKSRGLRYMRKLTFKLKISRPIEAPNRY